jgi:hypothetical protein
VLCNIVTAVFLYRDLRFELCHNGCVQYLEGYRRLLEYLSPRFRPINKIHRTMADKGDSAFVCTPKG